MPAILNSCQHQARLPRRQAGVALLVVLLLLLVLTLIGIAAMRSATFQERMAANSTFILQSQQAAESALQLAMNDTVRINAAIKDGSVDFPVDVDPNTTPTTTANAKIFYIDINTMTEGSSAGLMAEYRLEMEGVGLVAAASAEQVVNRGVLAPAPAPDVEFD